MVEAPVQTLDPSLVQALAARSAAGVMVHAGIGKRPAMWVDKHFFGPVD